MTNDETIEWADKQRQKLEGVGLSDALVQIINEICQDKDKELQYHRKFWESHYRTERIMGKYLDRLPKF